MSEQAKCATCGQTDYRVEEGGGFRHDDFSDHPFVPESSVPREEQKLSEIAHLWAEANAIADQICTLRSYKRPTGPTLEEVIDAIEECNTLGRDFELVEKIQDRVRKLYKSKEKG